MFSIWNYNVWKSYIELYNHIEFTILFEWCFIKTFYIMNKLYIKVKTCPYLFIMRGWCCGHRRRDSWCRPSRLYYTYITWFIISINISMFNIFFNMNTHIIVNFVNNRFKLWLDWIHTIPYSCLFLNFGFYIFNNIKITPFLKYKKRFFESIIDKWMCSW